MAKSDLTALDGLQELDRFLQWDLITVTPFGTPVVAAVGARLLPHKGEIWTSTTVGYGVKVRNIRLNPRVALLRAAPGAQPVLLRGEASIVSGDGTTNLTRLFELMGGVGTSRPFFGQTATSPFWRNLYREYWRRVLIRVRVIEVCRMRQLGWKVHPLRDWNPLLPAPVRAQPKSGPKRRDRATTGALDLRGRELLTDGVPAVLALVDERTRAPLGFPVDARPTSDGFLEVRRRPGLLSSRTRRASLTVRVIDDSFEVARMVGWIGSLEKGYGWREFRPRSAYGFGKPPGIVPDIAAGLAAAVMNLRADGGDKVSTPHPARAAVDWPGPKADRIQLPPSAWSSLEQLFLSCAAAAPWHAGIALISTDADVRAQETYLAQRIELERDWAHSILLRGRRRLGPAAISRATYAAVPRSADPRTAARRQEMLRERWRSELRTTLPPALRRGILPALGDIERAGGVISRRESLASAAVILASSAAATIDRVLPIRKG